LTSAYLTIERFKTMGLGVDLEGIEDVAIRSAITRASATVDAVCAVPRMPQKFDFRGGRMTDEAHTWYIDPYERPHPYQFWPIVSPAPIKAIEAFAIWATNHIRVEIDVDNIVINNSAGYIELSSLNLTQFGIFGAGITPLLGLYNPIAKSTYTYGWEFPVEDETLEPIDARTYAAQHQFWTDADVVVKVDDAEQTTGFTIDRTEGWVVFADNLAADSLVTASYTHPLPWEISQATAVIASEEIGEADLRKKGMDGVERLRVQEVEIERPRRYVGSAAKTALDDLPEEAGMLLSGYVFLSSR